MHIFECLKQDYRSMDRLAGRLLDGSASASRDQLFDLLWDEVESHAAAIEQTVYAALLQHAEGRAYAESLVRRAVDGADEIVERFAVLAGLKVDSPDWQDGVATLRQSLHRRFAEGEAEASMLVASLVGAAGAEALGDRFVEEKRLWVEIHGRAARAAETVEDDAATERAQCWWQRRPRWLLGRAGAKSAVTNPS